MPDISKCIGTDCPLKEKCYRYTSKPNAYRQSYDEFWKGIQKSGTHTTCEYFCPNNQTEIK